MNLFRLELQLNLSEKMTRNIRVEKNDSMSIMIFLMDSLRGDEKIFNQVILSHCQCVFILIDRITFQIILKVNKNTQSISNALTNIMQKQLNLCPHYTTLCSAFTRTTNIIWMYAIRFLLSLLVSHLLVQPSKPFCFILRLQTFLPFCAEETRLRNHFH
jgi:hypothetical protein